MAKSKKGGHKSPPRQDDGKFAKASEQKASDPHQGHAEKVEYQTKGLNKPGKKGLLLIIAGVASLFVLGLIVLIVGLSKDSDEKTESRADDSDTTTELTDDQRTLTAEEVAEFQNKTITTKKFIITHEGTRVPWKMRDGNGVLRPIKFSFGGPGYKVTGYYEFKGVLSKAWPTITGDDTRRITIPRCDIMIVQLTEEVEDDSLVLLATVDMTQSLDRETPKRELTQLEQLQQPDQSEDVTDTATEDWN